MKKWTQVPAGEINAATQRLWVAIGEHAETVASRIKNNPEFVTNVARFMVQGGHVPSMAQELARKIMGRNHFGLVDAIVKFGVNPTKHQLEALSEIPFSEEVLRSCKDTHILAAVFPMSILDILSIAKKNYPDRILFGKNSYRLSMYSFAYNDGEVSWQLVRKEPVSNSLAKRWCEQEILLSKDEEVPTARIMTYVTVGHFLTSGERLFEKTLVRTSDIFPDNNFVAFGDFDKEGPFFIPSLGDEPFGNLGVASAKKQ